MNHQRVVFARLLVVLTSGLLVAGAFALPARTRKPALPANAVQKAVVSAIPSGMQKRWLFVWRDMSDPKEVDRMIARFARARSRV